MKNTMNLLRNLSKPGQILVSSEDNLEWLLSDYMLTKEIQANMLELINRGFTFYQMVSPLSVNTMPQELLEYCAQNTTNPHWKSTFQMYLNQIPDFETNLRDRVYIDMAHLATTEEISSGKVRIASPFSTSSQHLCYTPETYILHPENILRLMEEYENYYSIPYENNIQGDYNLFANMDGLALLVRNAFPPLMIEITRPEIVMTCREYLLRKAERIGYDGIQKTKHYLKIKDLIRNLKEQL